MLSCVIRQYGVKKKQTISAGVAIPTMYLSKKRGRHTRSRKLLLVKARKFFIYYLRGMIALNECKRAINIF